jgi:hypothetical protein
VPASYVTVALSPSMGEPSRLVIPTASRRAFGAGERRREADLGRVEADPGTGGHWAVTLRLSGVAPGAASLTVAVYSPGGSDGDVARRLSFGGQGGLVELDGEPVRRLALGRADDRPQVAQPLLPMQPSR